MTFISFSCLINRPRTFSTVVTRTGESGHQWSPDLRGKAFTTSVIFTVVFSFLALIMFSFHCSLSSISHHEKVLNFTKWFFCISWDDHVVFLPPFILLMWYFTSIEFHVLNHPFVPGVNPIWSWHVILFSMLLNVCQCVLSISIMLRTFASVFVRDIGL